MENSSSFQGFLNALPKIDLHCHVDGSFSTTFIRKAMESSPHASNFALPDSDDLLLNKLRAPSFCNSLTEYLTCFDLPIACMQTRESITLGILDILEHAKKENVFYMELRFAPTCSVNDTLSYRDVYEAAIEGCKKGKMLYDIDSSIIACAMRHHSMDTNLAMLKAAREFLGNGLCAFDLAGDENYFPNHRFSELFEEGLRLEMPFTIHSGECGSVENIQFAMDAGAKRIGHGIALAKAPALFSRVKELGIGFELCPTSNYQTKAVSANDIYPLKTFLEAGILATFNTDNRTVSDTTLTKEAMLLHEQMGLCPEAFLQMYKNSVALAFADDAIKHRLLQLLPS